MAFMMRIWQTKLERHALRLNTKEVKILEVALRGMWTTLANERWRLGRGHLSDAITAGTANSTEKSAVALLRIVENYVREMNEEQRKVKR
jgi:hypothetical protein